MAELFNVSELAAIAHVQHSVTTRRQLHDLDVSLSMINANLRAHRWTTWGSHVVVLHNTTLTRRQLIWAAVLDAGPPAALGSHTALELSGFRAFAAEAERIHLVVARGAKVTRDPGVIVHESRRLQPEFQMRVQGLPCTGIAQSALDAAAWQPWPRFACAMVAAVVQQRLCTPADLELAMSRIGRIRHKAHLRAALLDIAGGSEALSESTSCACAGASGCNRRIVRCDGTWMDVCGSSTLNGD